MRRKEPEYAYARRSRAAEPRTLMQVFGETPDGELVRPEDVEAEAHLQDTFAAIDEALARRKP